MYRSTANEQPDLKIFQKDFLWLFEDNAVNVLTGINITIALLGILANCFVLQAFISVYGTKRYQSLYWMNLTIANLLQSVVIFYHATSTFVPVLANSETACKFRYVLPIMLDLITIQCYVSLLIERLIAVHFPIFYRFLVQSEMMLLYSWLYGFAFLLCNLFEVMDYRNSKQCMTPYNPASPQEAVSILTWSSCLFLIVVGLVSLFFMTPAPMRDGGMIDTLRLELEMRSTRLVVGLGTLMVLLWLPRQVISIMFWVKSLPIMVFEALSTVTESAMRACIILPFLVLLTRPEMRIVVKRVILCQGLDPIKQKFQMQEGYIESLGKQIQNLEENKYKAMHHLDDCNKRVVTPVKPKPVNAIPKRDSPVLFRRASFEKLNTSIDKSGSKAVSDLSQRELHEERSTISF